MAQEDERWVGAPEQLSRWWSRISGMRKILVVIGAVVVAAFLPLAILTGDEIWPQWVWSIWSVAYAAMAVYGRITNRRDANRELDEIARNAERPPEDAEQ